MNIEIKNFGPIEYLNIDLDKDLHLIYGKNAIGKSYAIYCVYCLLKSLKTNVLGGRESLLRELLLSDLLDSEIVNSIEIPKFHIAKGEIKDSERPILYFISLLISFLEAGPFQELKKSFLNTFSTNSVFKNIYNNNNFELIINLPESKVITQITLYFDELGEFRIGVGGEGLWKKFRLETKATRKNKFIIFIDNEKLIEASSRKELIEKFKTHTVHIILEFIQEFDKDIKDIYFLPASRSGLYQALNSFAPIIAELSQSRFFTKNRNIELPSLSEPVSDYFLDLSTIDRTFVNKEFEVFADLIEDKILKGKVEFNDKTKKIAYKPTGLEIELNLSEASSMVAELAPLVLFLRHIINPPNRYRNGSFEFPEHKYKVGYNIIFIEEPEAHLHPEIQVALMEVFAKLAKHNLKIFITSHSNYMFNELNNLILDNKIDREKIGVYHLIQTKNGTVQNPEMIVTEDGIYDENFQETSEKLYEERMRILEETNAH